jgi:hypothetical protein
LECDVDTEHFSSERVARFGLSPDT